MRYRSIRTLCLLLVLPVVFAAACDREASAGGPSSASHPKAEHADEETSDGEGEAAGETPLVARSDDIPETPKRIVSLAPNVTEILFALGVGDRIVAVTSHCDYPEAATELPSVGSFANPDVEMIVAKKPDLVVGVVSGNDRGVFERLKAVDVPYGFVRTDTIEETMRGIETIGRLVGRPGEAEKLTASMQRKLDALREQWRRGPAPSVLLVYGHEPLVAAGPGTFGHQLIEAAGANNVLQHLDTQFPRLDLEKVVELQPAVILDTAMVDTSSDRDFWSAHEAVESPVQYLTDPVVLRPGPRLPEALRRIGEAIYRAENPGGNEADGDAESAGGGR